MPITLVKDVERVKMLTEMTGITQEEQAILWNLVLNVDPYEAGTLADRYVAQGATYKYTKAEVDQKLGKHKPWWQRWLGL